MSSCGFLGSATCPTLDWTLAMRPSIGARMENDWAGARLGRALVELRQLALQRLKSARRLSGQLLQRRAGLFGFAGDVALLERAQPLPRLEQIFPPAVKLRRRHVAGGMHLLGGHDQLLGEIDLLLLNFHLR
jgi:hypothetical protein